MKCPITFNHHVPDFILFSAAARDCRLHFDGDRNNLAEELEEEEEEEEKEKEEEEEEKVEEEAEEEWEEEKCRKSQ